MAITPGGRPGDATPLGKKGGPRQLTDYTREIAHALMRRGIPESHAIAIAKNSQKRWRRGGGKVRPQVRAGAAASLAEQARLDASRSHSLSIPAGSAQDDPRDTMRVMAATHTRRVGGKKLRTGSIPSGTGKGAFPITNQQSVKSAAALLSQTNLPKAQVVAHVRAEAKKRGLKLTPAFKPAFKGAAPPFKKGGRGKSPGADLTVHDLVGPKGFKHGWVYVGGPGLPTHKAPRANPFGKSRKAPAVGQVRGKAPTPERAKAEARVAVKAEAVRRAPKDDTPAFERNFDPQNSRHLAFAQSYANAAVNGDGDHLNRLEARGVKFSPEFVQSFVESGGLGDDVGAATSSPDVLAARKDNRALRLDAAKPSTPEGQAAIAELRKRANAQVLAQAPKSTTAQSMAEAGRRIGTMGTQLTEGRDRSDGTKTKNVSIDGERAGHVYKGESRTPVRSSVGNTSVGTHVSKGFFAHGTRDGGGTEAIGHFKTRQQAVEAVEAHHRRRKAK